MSATLLLLTVKFNITNTIQNTLLENVRVKMQEVESSLLVPKFMLALPQCTFNAQGQAYMVFAKDAYPLLTLKNTLTFVMKELDDAGDADEGYEDEYELEDLAVCIGDYVMPLYGDFSKLWSGLHEEVVETYSLTAVSTIAGMSLSLLTNLQPR
jgi:Coatomer gamma subunit appendage platform subdomain